jgi:hypothetical protein
MDIEVVVEGGEARSEDFLEPPTLMVAICL